MWDLCPCKVIGYNNLSRLKRVFRELHASQLGDGPAEENGVFEALLANHGGQWHPHACCMASPGATDRGRVTAMLKL